MWFGKKKKEAKAPKEAPAPKGVSKDDLKALGIDPSLFEDADDETGPESFDKDVIDDAQRLGFTADIEDIDDVDLTEHDLNDPELLEDLKDAGWESDEDLKSERIAALHKAVADARQRALALKRAGDTAAACKALKESKEIQEQIDKLTKKSDDVSVQAPPPPPSTLKAKPMGSASSSSSQVPPQASSRNKDADFDSNMSDALAGMKKITIIPVPNLPTAGIKGHDMDDDLDLDDDDDLDLDGDAEEEIQKIERTDALKKQIVALKRQALEANKTGNVEKAEEVGRQVQAAEAEIRRLQPGAFQNAKSPASPAITPTRKPVSIPGSITPPAARQQSPAAPPPKPAAPPPKPAAPPRNQVLDTIEAQLHSQIEVLTEVAKDALKKGDKDGAREMVREKQHYLNDLEFTKLLRAQPSLALPKCRYEERKRTREVRYDDLSEAEMEFSVVRVTGVEKLTHSQEPLFVLVQLPYPSNDSMTDIRSPPFVLSDSDFKFVHSMQIDRKSRAFLRLLQNRKLEIRIFQTVPKQWFKASDPVELGHVNVLFKDLLTRSEILGVFDVVNSNRRPLGPKIQARIRLREPLTGKDIRDVTDRFLILERDTPPAPTTPTTNRPAPASPAVTTNTPKTSTPKPPLTPPTPNNTRPAASAAVGTPEDDELDDYDNADKIVSYEVLEAEIALVDQQAEESAKQGKAASNDMAERKQALELRKQLLMLDIQMGRLTPELYMKNLQESILWNKKMAVRLKQKGGPYLTAARTALRRAKVMEKEIQEAQQAAAS